GTVTVVPECTIDDEDKWCDTRITGLENGTSYTFTILGKSRMGDDSQVRTLGSATPVERSEGAIEIHLGSDTDFNDYPVSSLPEEVVFATTSGITNGDDQTEFADFDVNGTPSRDSVVTAERFIFGNIYR
ncbi:hypothetical protein ACFL2V_21000, partial [Pseudomonadota bacterium]